MSTFKLRKELRTYPLSLALSRPSANVSFAQEVTTAVQLRYIYIGRGTYEVQTTFTSSPLAISVWPLALKMADVLRLPISTSETNFKHSRFILRFRTSDKLQMRLADTLIIQKSDIEYGNEGCARSGACISNKRPVCGTTQSTLPIKEQSYFPSYLWSRWLFC